MEKIPFMMEDGTQASFFVLETTTLRGVEYLLVTEEETGDGECYIMKNTGKSEDGTQMYEEVEDDMELAAITGVFEELLEDVHIER